MENVLDTGPWSRVRSPLREHFQDLHHRFYSDSLSVMRINDDDDDDDYDLNLNARCLAIYKEYPPEPGVRLQGGRKLRSGCGAPEPVPVVSLQEMSSSEYE
ncbi:hypothetical protein DPMN_146317 [Dreissena polymorpha]|uniref:Uncharacterized protein n=1 Tax=Dreissena polymorpha TaxID=45954 RepID=A0A9D4F6E4_DREPO|nr:hypothetical protein DPMN_146317 [Dreissena polymorpha]